MSSLFGYVRETVASRLTSIYHGASTIAPSIRFNPCHITSIALAGIATFSGLVGQTISTFTANVVELNNIIPQTVRQCIRDQGGRRISQDIIDPVTDWIRPTPNRSARATRAEQIRDEQKLFIRETIIAPVVEEIALRFPLRMLSLMPSFLTQEHIPGLTPMNIMGAEASLVQIFWAVFSSVIFTYMHGPDPSSYFATYSLTAGLGLSYITLSQDGGIIWAIGAHMLHNYLISYCPRPILLTAILIAATSLHYNNNADTE